MFTNNVAFVLFTGHMLAGFIGISENLPPQASFHKKIATPLPQKKWHPYCRSILGLTCLIF